MGRHGVRARGADSGGLTWACRFFPGRADKPGPPGSAARWPCSEGTALAAQQWLLLESRLHPGVSLCSHPGLVLSSCELQSHENHFCVTLFVGEGRARSACAVPAQSRHGQRASAPCAPAPVWRALAGPAAFVLAGQGCSVRGRTCAPWSATLLFRISLSCLQCFLTPCPVQAGHFASFQGAMLCACWEMLLFHSLRRPFSPVV